MQLLVSTQLAQLAQLVTLLIIVELKNLTLHAERKPEPLCCAGQDQDHRLEDHCRRPDQVATDSYLKHLLQTG